jgi:phosphate uptake regulator
MVVFLKRKVVQHGPSTLIVSLPSAWVNTHNIKKGDELEVEEAGHSIIVSTGNEKNLGKVDIDVTGLDRSSLVLLIRNLYKLGYNEIHINFKGQSTSHFRLNSEKTILSVIHEEVNRLIGMEVVQQRENSCTIKVLSEMNFSEFDPMLRRIFLMMIDTSNDLIKGAEKGDKLLLQTIEEKHNTITKFVSFCLRLLNTKGYTSQHKTTILYHVITVLDKILDILKNTGRVLVELSPIINPASKKIMEDIHDAIAEYYELFYKFDNKSVVRISQIRDSVLNGIKDNYNSFSKKELVAITGMSCIVDMLTGATGARYSLEY